jgi:hypothetical protein
VIGGRHAQSTYGKAREESTSLDGKAKRAGCAVRICRNVAAQVMRWRRACAGVAISQSAAIAENHGDHWRSRRPE